ncbi:MlaD family protein [Aeoliella sp. ICT_H6.2]|uniref:MlaD family protein n=1 Tax=Aeoliella straminimaris TaxID=2954799 RepID=A0A9X2JJK5_9BACT|nr:MlaD family protein [Aeoliella straminimaris]MCO6046843.1 MlaD family protein [Aeoliella straminimaris]
MDERRMQRRVGWVVLFTITFLGILLVINNPAASPFGSRGYEFEIDVPSAPGVAINTPVRKDGVLVGRVSGLEWTATGVRLKVRINRDVVIYENDQPQVEPSSIFGDAVVTFTRKPVLDDPDTGAMQQPTLPGDNRKPILAGSVVEGQVTDDPLTAITKLNQNLGPSIEKLGEAGEKVAILADKMNQAIGDDISGTRISQVLDEATLTLQDFRRTTNNFDQLLADNELRGQLADALREFPGLMTDARGTLQRAGQTLANFDQVIGSADRNLQNIEGLTAPLGERGEEISDLLISAIDNLDIVMKDMSRFAASLNKGEGLLGRLVRDKKLSNDVDLLVRNATVLVYNVNERVRVDLEPILYNARVFTDKIAREPGRIIGGALNPSIVK